MVARSVSVLLLRHGRSEWNAVRRWQGLADSPLDDLGRRQAANAATALAVVAESSGPFAHVWSSPLRRAAETGEIIAESLGLRAPRVDERLREADAGEWEGLTPDQIEAAYPGYLASHFRPPTFEPGASVVARATAAIGEIVATARSDDGAVLITTHSGVIRSVARHLGAIDERVPNLGGVWLAAAVDGSATGIELQLRGRFDPAGVTRTGVDAPGEDPGEQPDEPQADRRTER